MACCEKWEPGIAQIDGALDMWRIHGFGDYTGGQFRYCPWCGLSLDPPASTYHARDFAELSSAERQSRGAVSVAGSKEGGTK